MRIARHAAAAPILALALAVSAAGAALAQDGAGEDLADPFVWSDPTSGCSYLVVPGTGITPRLRADGLADCPESRSSMGDDLERTLRRSGEELGGALQDLGRRLQEQR